MLRQHPGVIAFGLPGNATSGAACLRHGLPYEDHYLPCSSGELCHRMSNIIHDTGQHCLVHAKVRCFLTVAASLSLRTAKLEGATPILHQADLADVLRISRSTYIVLCSRSGDIHLVLQSTSSYQQPAFQSHIQFGPEHDADLSPQCISELFYYHSEY